MQVPLSPTRERREPVEPKSPARVMLGIDKGLRAENVSLKRPASTLTQSNTSSRAGSRLLGRASSLKGTNPGSDSQSVARTKSFSERLKQSRTADEEREKKQERIQNSRSQGFGFRQDEHVSTYNTPSASTPALSAYLSTDKARSALGYMPEEQRPTFREPRVASRRETEQELPTPSAPKTMGPEASSTLEPFSGLHLSKRNMSHENLTRILSSKELYTLPKLLKVVKGPHYDPPDVEGDYVVLGIIASKSSPREHANRFKSTTSNTADEDAKASGKNKFMVLRLVDLKWEVDLFLFDTAFSQFWKLTPGTLVAVLNPGVMPPKRGREDTGAFALKLASSEDTIIELGTARDLGFCKSIKKDGQECGSWINQKKTKFCDFHVNLEIDKQRAKRMEVNGMGRFGGGSKKDPRTGQPYDWSIKSISRPGRKPGEDAHEDRGAGRGAYDYDTQSRFYAIPGVASRSAVNILDNEDQGAFDRGMSREERDRKRRAEKQKERDLAKKLGELGSHAGGEYMRLKDSSSQGQSISYSQDGAAARGLRQDKADAGALGLLGKSATDVTLSPVKRKRGTGGGTSEPVGWGGAFKRGLLLSPKKSEAPTVASRDGSYYGSLSPTKKKARFFLERKGLREPGRDSLGVIGNELANDDDDEDELDII